MNTPSDRVRSIAVAVTAVTQVIASPLTIVALGPSSNTGTISDANVSPVTPAGYAFAIWGLIYLGCLALAVYQLLPGQRTREVHRRTGWWLVAAFAASTVWVPVFGSRTIWLSQVVILVLVGCLIGATRALRASGPAETRGERLLLRLPVTIYLGWATLASVAGFGTTLRSFGMPARAGWVTVLSLVLVLAATVVSVLIVSRLVAVAGFAFTACWALVAVAVGTYDGPVRVATLFALALVLAAVVFRSVRSGHRRAVLLG